MITKAHLIAARALIAEPSGWTTYAFGRNAAGDSVEFNVNGPVEPTVCHCLLGAIIVQLPPTPLWRKISAAAAALKMGATQVTSFNDRSTHAEVLELLDAVIERTPA
jgi:hypothetical protein